MRPLPPTALSVLLLASLAAAGARAERPGISREPLPTADGTRATLYHYVPEPGLGPRPALLLLPEVGTTRRAYDFDRRGLARYLAWYGVEVFVLEYRGAGASDWPASFDFETLLENDCEAAFARALAGRASIFVGGWGLGGTLAGLLASRHARQVAGFIGLQAAATLDLPNRPMAELVSRLERLPSMLDLRLASRRPLFEDRSWFEVMVANDEGLAAAPLRAMRLSLLAPLPRALIEDLLRFAREKRIVVGGEDVRESIARYRGRSLLVIAPRDNWIHPEFATPLVDSLGRERVEVLVLNPLEGARLEYGHLGMLLGSEAPRDVWAPILAFVKERR